MWWIVFLAVVALILAIVALALRGKRGRRGRRGPTGAGVTGAPDPLTLTYHLSIADFAASFIEIPTSTVTGGSPTIAASYLAGRAPLYDADDVQVGTCSASFLNMQTAENIFSDISNYLATDGGLIVTWFTPTTLVNLELDSVINGMVTEAIVEVTTKVGVSPFYGQKFNLVVSSDQTNISFEFTRIQ